MIYRNVTHGKNKRRGGDADFVPRNVMSQSEFKQAPVPGSVRVGLAPIAGTTGVTFRAICRRFGASYGC
ncbi:MAG: hypothetical protein JW817_02185, partial [Clostridiales bacterium]|nr:hypothetical protein [Clostridiales bacterium]